MNYNMVLTIVYDTLYNIPEVMAMNEQNELLAGLLLELRRGTIVLSVMSRLKEPTYGYLLVQELSEKGIPVEANTLYPLLRRLEKQGLLKSKWETSGAKPRKYYLRTPEGEAVYQKLKQHWIALANSMEELLEGAEHEQ